jgi:hypothetical protein
MWYSTVFLPGLTSGGVKAYILRNFQNMKGAEEHFKLFVSLQASTCMNLCEIANVYAGDAKVKSLEQLRTAIYMLVRPLMLLYS